MTNSTAVSAFSAKKQLGLWCMLLLCVVFYCFFRISIVEGSSMDNTLANQDKLLLLTGLYTAECGDIVVVEDAATGLDHPIIKRIIAVGGQRVRFTPDAIYVDGVELEEVYKVAC